MRQNEIPIFFARSDSYPWVGICLAPSRRNIRSAVAVAASRPEFDSGTVTVVVDERIFTLFAALNAAEFD